MIYSIYIFFRFIVFFYFRIYIYFYDFRIIMEWELLNRGFINLEMLIFLDWVSLLFLRLVIIISSIIFLYRKVYIREEKFKDRFILLVFIFIISIIFIIVSPNIFRILFGWDGLGLVSYCLVIYYQNYISYNSGIVTVLSNRIGDIGLLISIGLIVNIYGRCRIWVLRDSIIIILLVLSALTKRAQIPFSSWLPMAMAAPTPVSALVHSSTLVTAGVYLIIRFNKLLIFYKINNVLLFISVSTIFIAGLIANFENDLKKIIALSTLSQLGLIIMILRLGLRIISFYHLLTHAIFKSLLFICAGIIIHLINNNQDIRGYGSLNELIPFTIIRFYISNLSLCGFPFLAGFYSKDLIIEIIYLSQINLVLLIIIIFSLILTVSYSFRLFYYLFFGEIKFNRFIYVEERTEMNISMIILILLRILYGRVLNWIFMFDLYIPYLGFYTKIRTLILCFLGVILGFFMCKLILINMYMVLYFLGSMWFLNLLIVSVYKPVLVCGNKISMIDKIWLEYSSRLIVKFIIMNYSNFKFNSYKIFIFILIYINLFILLIIFIYLNSLRKLKHDIEDIKIIF